MEKLANRRRKSDSKTLWIRGEFHISYKGDPETPLQEARLQPEWFVSCGRYSKSEITWKKVKKFIRKKLNVDLSDSIGVTEDGPATSDEINEYPYLADDVAEYAVVYCSDEEVIYNPFNNRVVIDFKTDTITLASDESREWIERIYSDWDDDPNQRNWLAWKISTDVYYDAPKLLSTTGVIVRGVKPLEIETVSVEHAWLLTLQNALTSPDVNDKLSQLFFCTKVDDMGWNSVHLDPLYDEVSELSESAGFPLNTYIEAMDLWDRGRTNRVGAMFFEYLAKSVKPIVQ